MGDELRDIRNPGWYWCANELIERDGKELGVYGIAVYNVLACMAGQKGECFPSFQTIADRIGCSRRKVIDTINHLEQLGWVQKEPRKDNGSHNSNTYFLVDTPGGSARDAPGVVHEMHQGSARDAPKQYDVNDTKLNKKVSADADVPDKEELTYNEKRTILEEHFSSVTGIPLPKRGTDKEKKAAGTLWWGPLKEILDWCDRDVWAAKRIISAAVKEMDAENLTIKAPKSILGNATDIFRKQNGGGNSNEKRARWMLRQQYGESCYIEQQPASDAVERTNGEGVVWRVSYSDGQPAKAWMKEVKVNGEWVPATKEKQIA